MVLLSVGFCHCTPYRAGVGYDSIFFAKRSRERPEGIYENGSTPLFGIMIYELLELDSVFASMSLSSQKLTTKKSFIKYEAPNAEIVSVTSKPLCTSGSINDMGYGLEKDGDSLFE